ncbi:MAG: hypothetical protein HY961_14305 [Ignavibacteriae bacterium]|nr:hypothetical protein [Ignavibacteriota bacterium]
MKHHCYALCMLLLAVASTGFAQNLNWNITGAGARAEGFGGAFIGVADDATAIVWNPAGLGQIERTEFSVVGRFLQEVSEDKNEFSKTTIENTYSHFNPNFASVAIPFPAGTSNMVLAVAYQSQLDFYYKAGKDSINSTGGASTITPAVAMRVGSVFAFGAAANIWLGNADQTVNMPPWKRDLSFSFTGLNFTGGVLLDFAGLSTPIPWKVGVTFRSPFTLKSDADRTFTNSAAPSTVKDKFHIDIDMPLMVGVGTSFRIGESFTIAGDFETRMFADKKSNVTVPRTGMSDTTFSSPMSDHNENLSQVRVGAEYLIVTSSGVFPVRAGFRTVPTLYSNYEWDQTNITYKSKSAVSGIGFSVGTGFISGSFALDFAFSHDQYDQTWTDAGKTDYSYKYNVNRVSGSVIVYL